MADLGGFGAYPTPGYTPPTPPKPAAAASTAKSAAPLPVPGHVVLWAPEIDVELALRNRALPQITAERAGGFRSIPVPQLRPITTWDGYPQIELTLVGMFDQSDEGAAPTFGSRPRTRGDVRDDLRELRRLGMKVSGNVRRPPLIRVIGRVPVPTTGTPEYVLTGLQVVEELYNDIGIVTRALCTLTLQQYVSPEIELRVKKVERQPATTYVWKKTDTLAAVAKRELGDSRRQDEIRDANPGIKRFTDLKAGTKIKVPAR